MTPSARFAASLLLCASGLTAVSNAQDVTARKSSGIVDRALVDVGYGSTTVLKNRLFSYQITVVGDQARQRATDALPENIRRQQISQGKLFRRIATDLEQVLQLHERLDHGKVELFLFHDDIPTAKLWRGAVLLISDGLAELLSDAEMIGVLAHELGHSYFEDEMAAAQRQKDTQAMKVIELKCDAVAIISLKLLGQEPTVYMGGLKRMKEILRRKSLSGGIVQSHPALVEREQFLVSLSKRMPFE